MQYIYLLLAFFLAPALGAPNGPKQGTRDVLAWLESPRITNWGTWSEEALCPAGTYVRSFRLKVQVNQGIFLDDTALNSVELYCNDTSTTSLKSGEASHGNWGTFFECDGDAIANGFELRQEGLTFDNTAANNLALFCNGNRLQGNGESFGEWTGRLNCPMGANICGIKTQIAVGLPQPGVDDTALNNLDIGCCRD